MSIFIGLDVGTSGARAVAVDERANVVAEASASYPLYSPRPGWTEQDPEDWWRATRDVLRAVAAKVGEPPLAIGLTGQMHGSVFLDPADRVIRPALLWNDQRTAVQCELITERIGVDNLIRISGNPALTGFQAPKILWLREHEPKNYDRVAHVLLPKDYVRLRLTGQYATDASDASGTLLLEVRARDWSDEILAALDIPRSWLPKVYEGTQVTGTLRDDVAGDLGLPAGTLVAAGGGDNAAAAVGTGVVEEGLLSSSIGTSGVLFAETDQFVPDPSGRLHAFCHAVPGKYHLMGVTLSAGGSFGWWREIVGVSSYDELSALAAEAPPGSEGLIFLPYLTGERSPHLDPAARGGFIGLAARHGRAHLSRAVMEGVVFSLNDSMEIIRELGVVIREIRATGGGARGELWRQLQADIYDAPIRRTVAEEGPAYGAALLGGVAAGVFGSVEDACALIRLRDEVTRPDPERVRRYAEYYGVYRGLYEANRDAMHRLTALAEC